MSDHETHPTVRRMEETARGLFRNADNQDGPKPDEVNWWERVKAWLGKKPSKK